MDSTKVLLIGLDGATFDIIFPMIRRNMLPCISRLMQEGTYGTLKSTVPELSPVAWTSMVTGKKPGMHAIFDFVAHVPGSYRFKIATGGERRAAPIWRLLSEKGKRVGVVNVTMSYPPEEVNGFMVSGMDSPGIHAGITFPESLYREMELAVGKYMLTNPYVLTSRRRHLQGIFEMVDNRAAAMKYLLETKSWDFFMGVFIETDGVQHFYWKDMDVSHPDHDPTVDESFKRAIFDVYRRLDEKIALLIEAAGDECTVVLVSDHGFQPLHKMLSLNDWLAQEGYLARKKVWVGNIKENVFRGGGKVRERILKKFGKGNLRHDSAIGGVDWDHTRAFAEGSYGYIFVNLAGREPKGIIHPGQEYEALCDELIEGVSNIKAPNDGMPVVEKVYRREEIFQGPFLADAPDLIVTCKDRYFAAAKALGPFKAESDAIDSRGLFRRHVWSGNHSSEGIFIMRGPNIKKGHEVENAEIIDVVPTLLRQMGVGEKGDFDGKILVDVFSTEIDETKRLEIGKDPGVQKRHVSKPDRPLSADEENSVRERLRDLGYLD